MCRLRSRITAARVALALTLLAAALAPGCGSGGPGGEQAAQYSAESLAQELLFRYRSLTPETKKASTRSRSKRIRSLAEMENSEKLQKKGGSVATTKKHSGPPTFDDLLDDIETKLSLIKG